MQQTVCIAKTKEKRTHFSIPKSATDTVGGEEALDLLHAVAFTGSVRDDLVQGDGSFRKLVLRWGWIWRRRRQANPPSFREKFSGKPLQTATPFPHG
jgi:hypothetical protein